MKIIFMGTPDFAATALKSLAAAENIEVKAVITQPDKPVGRKKTLTPPEVKVAAEQLGIPVNQPKNKKQLSEILTKHSDCDFFIVVAFGMILTKEMLSIPKHGCINIHGSLLPQYRGASPIHQSLLNGDKETGITIMRMDDQLDHGDIYLLKRVQIEDQDDIETLYEKLAKTGAEILPQALEDIKSGMLSPIKQNHDKATFCQKIEKNDGQINWSKNAEQLIQQIKAYKVWPGTYSFINGKKITIIKASYSSRQSPLATITIDEKNNLLLGTREGSLILETIQMEGKNAMTAKDFLNGQRNTLPLKLDI